MTKQQAFIKRLADIVVSVIGLVLSSPVLLAAALAVKLEDGGPVLFRQERVTKDGRVFRILKFRTMRIEDGHEYVTRAGAFLRHTWIDELPQFVNVLAGDMSVVGPRPEMLSDVTFSKEICPEFSERECMRAGMTGLAQILGSADTPPREKLAFDRFYIDHFSLGLDGLLIVQTLLTGFFAKK